MTIWANDPQPAIPGVPASSVTPSAYLSGADAEIVLRSRYGLTGITVPDGIVLAASMALDEEGPWTGSKLIPNQERSFPRTFKYGWPYVMLAPAPSLVTSQRPGAWMMDFEGVVPQQIIDWTCLEAYRYLTQPLTQEIASESISGVASIKYVPPAGSAGGWLTQMDKIQASLIQPFQKTTAGTMAFPEFVPG